MALALVDQACNSPLFSPPTVMFELLESIRNRLPELEFCIPKAAVELLEFLNVVAPPSAIVTTAVALSLKTAMLPVEVELETFRASPLVAPVKEVKAEVTVRVLPAATVVFWFKPIAVAVVVPRLSVPAETVSTSAVRTEVD